VTVYFAEEVGTGAIKIGYTESNDPQSDRIGPALTMTSHDVVVRAVLLKAERGIEKQLHSSFSAYRIKRRDGGLTEFFSPVPSLWHIVDHVSKTGKLPQFPIHKFTELMWEPRYMTHIEEFIFDTVSAQIPFRKLDYDCYISWCHSINRNPLERDDFNARLREIS
jgi:hypothetical protein